MSDARFMWIWLRTTCVPFYDLYWTARGVQEFEAMFGRKPFSNPELEGIPEAHAYEVLREEMDKAIVHFGEGRMNPSTIASVLALVEERLTGRVAEPAPFSASSRALFAAIGWATPK